MNYTVECSPRQKVRKLRPGEIMPTFSTADLLLGERVYLSQHAENGRVGGTISGIKKRDRNKHRFIPHAVTIKTMVTAGAKNIEISRAIGIHISSVSRYIVANNLREIR